MARDTVEGLGVGGSEKSGAQECACAWASPAQTGISEIVTHRAAGLRHLHIPAKERPSHCVPVNNQHLWAPSMCQVLAWAWGSRVCPGVIQSLERPKETEHRKNPRGPLASRPACHPRSFAWPEFTTIFLFGSQGSNLCGVRAGDAKHLYL